jgi:GxxExxY protein
VKDLTQRRQAAKDTTGGSENEIAQVIVDACFHIHTRLGPGLLESVYEAVLARELGRRGLTVHRRVTVPIVWEGLSFDEGLRADLIVADTVLVELKSVERLAPVHKKQLLTYLRLMDKRLGLLVNFGAALIKDGIKRVVNGLVEEVAPQDPETLRPDL